jgi:hypothetical protein
VDFLGTHMISLVLFFRKSGVTRTDELDEYLKNNVDTREKN